jgi:hypothetical protein
MAASPLQTKTDALLAVLDEDIRHVQTVLKQLDQLRNLLIKRDDGALERLLVDLQHQTEEHVDIERRRQNLRRELAEHLQCDVQTVTLSALAQSVPDPLRRDVSERRMTLKSLIDRLGREYALTRMLIADCARFNRALIRVFFGQDGRGKTSYGANGLTIRRADATLMSLHF